MSEPTPHEKLEAVKCELIILLPRLTGQYRPSMETCIQYCTDVQVHLKENDNENN